MESFKYYLIIGRANAGKTTHARKKLEEYLRKGIPAVILDGDCVRNLYGNDDYTDIGRTRNLKHVAELAKWYLALGIIPIIAMVCPMLSYRRFLRDEIGMPPTLIYIEGGELWEGTHFEEPCDEFEFGCIRISNWRLRHG